MRVETHLHIRKFVNKEQSCISVRPLPNFQTHYSGTVTLANVTFAVQKAGLQRFRTSGQKNVHAFVRGDLVEELGNQVPLSPGVLAKHGWREAYYNPKFTDTFVDRQTGEPIALAKAAYLSGNKVWYQP